MYLFFLSPWLTEITGPPKLPVKSVPNKLTLTSNGCCFWVEDVNVSLRSGSGEYLTIAHKDTIYEENIFEYEIPDFSGSPVELKVEFHVYYGDEVVFSFPVMEIEDIDALKTTGVLLYFQEHDDMYLNVIAGDYHATYKKGNENQWTLRDSPNKVSP